MAETFAARLKQTNLTSKNDIVDIVKKTDFDDKLTNIDKKVASNKTNFVLVENELNEPSEKVKLIGMMIDQVGMICSWYWNL